MSETFDKFKDYLDRMNQFGHVNTLLYWDMRTNTPKEGFEGHSRALTHFSTEEFAMSTAPELKKLLDTLAQPDEYEQLDEMWKFVVTKMKKDLDKRSRIPKDFYESFVQAQTESENAWEEAKEASDFSIFAPHLQKMIEMTEQMTAYTDPGVEVYEALLDQYEKGMDSATIDGLFTELKEKLMPLVQSVLAAEQPDDAKFCVTYEKNAQKEVERLLLSYIGFDWNRGTVGESTHPFTLNFSSKDVRVTNHFYEHDPLSAMYSAIHEGGHAIFEQNVNPAYDGTVAGSCNYMGIHESQSRFYENILGRNKNFWVPVYEQVQQKLLPLQNVSLEEFYREINHVRNSFIRTEADELTYCFHIIIRYEIEKAIFRDHVKVEELPALWNAKMQEYLQITPANDAEGILQDMHWSDGSFGYFPSYLLGSIYDGMYLEALEAERGSVDELLAAGRIGEITQWLNEKIHWYGSTREPKEVIENVCGREVSAEPLIHYFENKYKEIYKL